MQRRPPLILAAALVLSFSGCSRAPQDATPEGVVRLWLDRMEASTDDPRAAHEAYLLLGPRARANLEERADRASKMQGRQETAEQMLAQGRFGLKFRPKSMVSTISGNDATVNVIGADSTSEHTSVHCVSESGAWRIEPDLPPVAQLRRRDDDSLRDGG
ncbi:MAG: hypothetical protein ABI461_05605 [Polyangiaceae bacterium]